MGSIERGENEAHESLYGVGIGASWPRGGESREREPTSLPPLHLRRPENKRYAQGGGKIKTTSREKEQTREAVGELT